MLTQRHYLSYVVPLCFIEQHGTKLVKYEGKKDKKEEEKRLEEINPPEGWIFRDSDEWKMDVKGAVDEEGDYP